MDYPIDLGGVTDMPLIKLEVEIFLHPVDVESEVCAIWKVVDNGVDFTEVNGTGKQFHKTDPTNNEHELGAKKTSVTTKTCKS